MATIFELITEETLKSGLFNEHTYFYQETIDTEGTYCMEHKNAHAFCSEISDVYHTEYEDCIEGGSFPFKLEPVHVESLVPFLFGRSHIFTKFEKDRTKNVIKTGDWSGGIVRLFYFDVTGEVIKEYEKLVWDNMYVISANLRNAILNSSPVVKDEGAEKPDKLYHDAIRAASFDYEDRYFINSTGITYALNGIGDFLRENVGKRVWIGGLIEAEV